MKESERIGKIHSSMYPQCQQRGYAAPVDVLMETESSVSDSPLPAREAEESGLTFTLGGRPVTEKALDDSLARVA